jgi:hypothetical protein
MNDPRPGILRYRLPLPREPTFAELLARIDATDEAWRGAEGKIAAPPAARVPALSQLLNCHSRT